MTELKEPARDAVTSLYGKHIASVTLDKSGCVVLADGADKAFAIIRPEGLFDGRGNFFDLSDTPETFLDPRDPDYSRSGIFVHHDCCRCRDGELPCVNRRGSSHCEYPHARND